jgi:hypothetical protein
MSSQHYQRQLLQIETQLRKQWRLGQNIVLCWCPDPNGLLLILVPHYFLGNFTAKKPSGSDESAHNEHFIRQVISGSRRRTHEELFDIARRLHVSTTFIRLEEPLHNDAELLEQAETVISRYGIGFVERRAVLLFDIAEFSLHSPFEQASQLNSLSYSMNSAYNKLQREGVEVNFARTTTGDGYYVWNRDIGPYPDLDLLIFLLLILVDNAVARSEASGATVPVIRSAFHIGSHYELFQAEGVNPTVFSYIVGDVTIALARMLNHAKAGQVLMGDFQAPLPERMGQHDASEFLKTALREIAELRHLKIGDKQLSYLSLLSDSCGGEHPTMLSFKDKHGITHSASPLHFQADLEGTIIEIGSP